MLLLYRSTSRGGDGGELRAHKIAHFPEGSGGVVQDLSAVSRRCALQEKADLRQTGAITTSVLDCAQ